MLEGCPNCWTAKVSPSLEEIERLCVELLDTLGVIPL